MEPRQALETLGNDLAKLFAQYSKDRSGSEAQWLKNLYQYLGKYDSDELAKIDAGRSKAYPRLTRVKVVSIVSRLMSLLFPMTEKNWTLGCSPYPELTAETLQAAFNEWAAENPNAPVDLKNIDDVVRGFSQRKATKAERIIEDQLQNIGVDPGVDYVSLVRKVVFSAVLYSAGVICGPMTLSKKRAEPVLLQDGTWTVEQRDVFSPMFEFVPLWDYYPEMAANSFASMDGQFHRRILSKAQLLALAKREDFIGDKIKEFVDANPAGNWTKASFEVSLEALSNDARPVATSNKYEVLSWWGTVEKRYLVAMGVYGQDDDLGEEALVEANVWFIGNTIVKITRSPFPEGFKYYHQFVFEEDEVNLLGSGLPPVMRDSALNLARATRMLVDNAAVCCGPQLEVDMSLLDDSVSDVTTVSAFRIWYTEAARKGGGQSAIRNVSIDSHIPELMEVIQLFRDTADAETFVGPQTGGDFANMPSEGMRTTAGASMIMATTALPFRDIVRNFDSFTMSVIGSLYQWNLVFNPDHVAGDLQPIARGATSLMAKEVRAIALDNLAQTIREEESPHVDWRKLVSSRFNVRDLVPDDLLRPMAEVQQELDANAQQAQQQLDLNNRSLEATIKKTLADSFKGIAQGQKNLIGAQTDQLSQVVAAIEKGVDIDHAAKYIHAEEPQPGNAQVPPGQASQPVVDGMVEGSGGLTGV